VSRLKAPALILFLVLLLPFGAAHASKTLKVGVYDNSPISFQDKSGKFRGLGVEVLEYIAKKEDWNIEFVFGTFKEHLKRLKNGEIDVLVYIAYTEERALIYDYTNEPLITNWGTVYTLPGSGIKIITDLDGKRVAILGKSILSPAFNKLANSFNIEFEKIDVDSNTEGFELVSEQRADAVVVNRIFGLINATQFNLEKTDIIFSPSEVRYATPKGKNADLIVAIDKHLKILKSDKQSMFYQSFNSAFKLETPVRLLPKWIFWAAGLSFFVIILLFIMNRTLNHLVREKTRTLNSEIAERKKAEEVLLSEKDKLQTIFEAMHDGAYIVNQDYDIEYANPVLVAEFGPYEGRKCYSYFHELEDFCPWCRNPEVFAGKTVQWEFTLSKSGKTYDLVDTPIRNADGSISKLEILRDITERKKAEEERQRLEEQLQHSQKLDSLGVLAGGIAHDFNNLLMGIMGNVGMAQMKLSPESPGHTHLSGIQVAAERAAELTNQMLAYSGKGKFDVKSINLTSVIEEMSHLLQVSVSKNVTIKYDLDKDLPAIEADPSQLHQIIMNLLSNSSDSYDGKSGDVVVSTTVKMCDKAYLSEFQFGDELPEGKYVYLEVSDTGSGMDEDVIESIFDPFFSTKEGGRGLGLSAVIGIVRGHNGAIKVISEPDRGTTFKLLFPASEKTAEEVV